MCACVCLPRCQGLRHSGRKWLCEWFAARVVVRVSEGPLCSLSCPGVNCRGAVRWFRCRGELIVPTCIWLITQTMAALGWMENLILRLWVISPFNYKSTHSRVHIPLVYSVHLFGQMIVRLRKQHLKLFHFPHKNLEFLFNTRSFRSKSGIVFASRTSITLLYAASCRVTCIVIDTKQFRHVCHTHFHKSNHECDKILQQVMHTQKIWATQNETTLSCIISRSPHMVHTHLTTHGAELKRTWCQFFQFLHHYYDTSQWLIHNN